ncbi:hypothetical protein Cgig2_010390 [Carnegiea gigantea]|uniref:RNase H type-1 domain-containing protein n=1 Tax=Carnegiea gigantea TaxID=171969 RepID=A0A9Q1K930_9CARY|nr:hypothetical protein Cgig2_010390 [Carnegiea gigantea]
MNFQRNMERLIKWVLPPPNWLLSNWMGHHERTWGIMRDHLGGRLRGFAFNSGICSLVKAGLLGLLHGLRITWNSGFKKLLVRMDLEMAIKIILKPVKHYQLYHFIIKECQDLLHKEGWRVKIEHCYHEANKAADRCCLRAFRVFFCHAICVNNKFLGA